MKERKFEYWVGDFETTVYPNQESTEVWASALVPLYSERVAILHSIDDTFKFLKALETNIVVYYHNLKFDGAFWIDFLINKAGYKQAYTQAPNPNDRRTQHNISWMDISEMPRNSFQYLISDMGQWYSITIHYGDFYIVLRDSLKLLPFSVRRIGESFKTKHRKLDMETIAPLSTGFPRQEYCNGLPFAFPWDLNKSSGKKRAPLSNKLGKLDISLLKTQSYLRMLMHPRNV